MDAPSFVSLPTEALKHIFSFRATVPEYLALERTCSTFRDVLAEDSVWKKVTCPEEGQTKDKRLKTYREQACVEQNLEYIKKQQAKTSNLLLEAFGDDVDACGRWKAIINAVLADYLPNRLNPGRSRLRYVLRGDTMGTILETLQTFLITT